MPSFHIPTAAEITPMHMTDADRGPAMRHILAECRGNFDARVAVETAHRLRYSISEIGASYFFAALDEAQASSLI